MSLESTDQQGVDEVSLKERLGNRKYSRANGPKAIAAKSEELGGSVSYDWIMKFQRGEIVNPGYATLVKLKAALDATDPPEILVVRQRSALVGTEPPGLGVANK